MMMNKMSAIKTVVKYIKDNELYSFKSLAEETQEKLISAYGQNFEAKVNAQLGVPA